MENIYIEEVISRYNQPINSGSLEEFDVSATDVNPVCGDSIKIQMKFQDDTIKEIKFQGQGCAISQASVDILIDSMKDKNIEDVKKLTSEEFINKLGIELSPLRLKCALLGLKVLKTAVYTYLGK